MKISQILRIFKKIHFLKKENHKRNLSIKKHKIINFVFKQTDLNSEWCSIPLFDKNLWFQVIS